jgi:hypothetical protein
MRMNECFLMILLITKCSINTLYTDSNSVVPTKYTTYNVDEEQKTIMKYGEYEKYSTNGRR